MKDIREKFKIKEKNFKQIVTVIIAVIISSLLTGTIIYYINNKNIILNKMEKELLDTYKSIQNSYYEDINLNELKDAAIKGMMSYLNEDYSEILNSEDNKNLLEQLNGKYKGIGVTARFSENGAVITEVHPDSPAENAGLEEGDIIKLVDGVEITLDNFSNINSLIKDKDSVKVNIIRNSEELTKTINVKSIIKPSISQTILESNNKKVGYIYIETFSSTTAIQVKSAVEAMEKSGIDSLILDVRSNTGGYLDVARDIASLFITKGKTIYQLEAKDKKTIIKDETDESRNYDIAIITNQVTASASEILALALKESYGAIIVGTKTYGKGRVQTLDSLSNNESVKLTTAKWYSPNGNSIDGVGITPGVYVELDKNYIMNPTTENDPQLQKALQILTNN